jgi:hypothetical protein
MPTEKRYISRTSIPALLTQHFFHDYESALKHYKPDQKIEITEHLLKLFDAVEAKDDGAYSILEEALVKKYGKGIKQYRDAAIHKYFQFELVLAEKDIYSSEAFNELSGDEQTLSADEIKRFIHSCRNVLRGALYHLYAERDPEFETEPEVVFPKEKGKETDKDVTRSRQLLAIYYLLKSSFNIEHRQSNFISDSAKFAHLLTGIKFTSLQTSDIYKKFQKLPNHKKGVALLEDLKYIRPFFENLGMDKALQLIDEEIRQTKKELPYTTRKKYEDE